MLSSLSGWRLRLTPVFASWGSGEFGYYGATELVEEYIHLIGGRTMAYLNVDLAIIYTYNLMAVASPLMHHVSVEAAKREVPLRVVDEDACEDAYRKASAFNTKFPEGFQGIKICAGSRDDKPWGACRGDSGGPLMVQPPDGPYQLIGIVSTGVGCGSTKFPGTYTKVSSYIDWILGNLIE
ncbi:proclotting enzyme-like [Pollicipes pollicipes]|uniref:proclotting enzyme-like n=1 Tax=Pollicipes pollicipes TaxID=41117 RepID=UPI0018855A52|nr:proclotting enzyme-like [Pollicipes pollicipes]